MLGCYPHPGRTRRKLEGVGCLKRTYSSCYPGTDRTAGSTLGTFLTPLAGQKGNIRDGQGRSNAIDTAPTQVFCA